MHAVAFVHEVTAPPIIGTAAVLLYSRTAQGVSAVKCSTTALGSADKPDLDNKQSCAHFWFKAGSAVVPCRLLMSWLNCTRV